MLSSHCRGAVYVERKGGVCGVRAGRGSLQGLRPHAYGQCYCTPESSGSLRTRLRGHQTQGCESQVRVRGVEIRHGHRPLERVRAVHRQEAQQQAQQRSGVAAPVQPLAGIPRVRGEGGRGQVGKGWWVAVGWTVCAGKVGAARLGLPVWLQAWGAVGTSTVSRAQVRNEMDA